MELDGRERAVLADLVMWEGAGRGLWLSGRLNLPYEETHIGYFSDYLCEETIRECEKVMENWNGNRRGRAA